ncbi:hypothetical protein LR48_Vigan05g144300 [Vigna angularis]|uniref:Uncharacterized protein n=2 Tax=Phaseolus angularis TaxID=3914 RepID=A0A0L9UM51_PHAAN|nr:hypothetical protein LR48_Vigan05g144300 [Vigna angularis]BAT92415.1 hypothetical protein VIGAN_07112400 [Vigna angularis var. angularis]
MMFGTLSGGDCRRIERWLSWFIGWHAANSPSGVSYGIYCYNQVNIFGNVMGGRHGVQLFQLRMHGFSWNTSIVRRIPFVSMAANNWLLHEAGPPKTILIPTRFDSPSQLYSQLV